MACNCATDEQIKELYRRYGERRKPKKTDSFKARAKYYLYTAGVYVCMVPIAPLLVLYVLYKALYTDDKKIDVVKFFRLDKKKKIDVGQQQVI